MYQVWYKGSCIDTVTSKTEANRLAKSVDAEEKRKTQKYGK